MAERKPAKAESSTFFEKSSSTIHPILRMRIAVGNGAASRVNPPASSGMAAEMGSQEVSSSEMEMVELVNELVVAPLTPS